MRKLVFGVMAVLVGMPLSAFALSISCPENDSLRSQEQLENAYKTADIVFLANAELDRDSDTTRWRYSLIEPVLKGSVKPEGYLDHGTGICEYVEATIKGVYLVFWSEPNEPITQKNTALVVYGDPAVAEEWALEWAVSKAHNK